MFVILEKNYCGYEDGYSVSSIIGPFSTAEEANTRATELNKLEFYGVEFSVEDLKLSHWSDK